MPKCDFNKVAVTLQDGCSLVNLLHIFRIPFHKNTSGGLLPNNHVCKKCHEARIASYMMKRNSFI